MRVLICAEEAPAPPANGFRTAVASLIEHLRPANDVHVVAFRAPDQSLAATGEMRLVTRSDTGTVRGATLFARALVRRRPLRADAMASRIAPALREEIERFRPEVVHVTAGRLGALGRTLEGRASVLAALDAPHLNVEARADRAPTARRRLLRGEAARLRRFEATEWHRFGSVVVVSREDRDELRAIDPRIAVQVIPGGIDPAPYGPRPDIARVPGRLAFHGVLDYAPNIAAAEFLARRILPRVRATRPDAHLLLVGRKPGTEVRSLERFEGVRVAADVPDVTEWLAAATVYVCPMSSGTGVKNKLLEAMANGLPCVATPLAIRGLVASPGRDLLVGDSEDEIATTVLRILGDPGLGARVGDAARAYVASEHDWATIAGSYEALYRRLSDRALDRSTERPAERR